MYFPSKRDRWLGAVLAIPFVLEVVILAATFEPEWFREGVVLLLALGALPLLLVPWIWFTTGYRIAGDQLEVRSGPVSWRIPLASITAVRPSRSIAASPALSLDRLEVVYGANQSILISPADSARFIDALRRHCPTARIEFDPGQR